MSIPLQRIQILGGTQRENDRLYGDISLNWTSSQAILSLYEFGDYVRIIA